MSEDTYSSPIERRKATQRVLLTALLSAVLIGAGRVLGFFPANDLFRDTCYFLAAISLSLPFFSSLSPLRSLSRYGWVAPFGGGLIVFSQLVNLAEEVPVLSGQALRVLALLKDATIFSGVILLFASLSILLLRLYEAHSREVRKGQEKDVEIAQRIRDEEYFTAQTEVLDWTSEGFVLLDREFRIAWFSRRMEGLLDLPRNQVLGMPGVDFARRILLPALAASSAFEGRLLASYQNDSPEDRFVFHMKSRSESEGDRWIEYRTEPIATGLYSGGRIQHFSDITDLKRAEEAIVGASRIEATATLAGGVAHDFNNLMVGVMGNAELLRQDAQDGTEYAAMLDAIIQSAERAGFLATQMLHFARGGGYYPQEVNLNQVVQEVLKFRQQSLFSTIEMAACLEPDLPLIWADASQLHEILNSLLNNSIEAIHDKGRITVKSWVEPGNQGETHTSPVSSEPFVCLSVEDDGEGMDEETQARLFEPFYTTKFQGRGIGLSSVYGIVRNHKGKIDVESEAGKGTCVQVSFPVYREKSSGAEPCVPRPAEDGKRTILLIEDEEVVRNVTQRLLEDKGFQVLTARNGKEGVSICGDYRGKIDLAILDMAMPVMNGPKTFPLLKQCRPDIPVLLFSGYDMDHGVQSLLEQGADAFIRKPVHGDQLAAEIERILGK